MSFTGLYFFNNSNFERPEIDEVNEEYSFERGWLTINKHWIRRLDRGRFILSHNYPNSSFYSTISRSALPNQMIYGDADFDFFLDRLRDLNSPILFAILFDLAEQKIHIARDAFGTVPIFYIHIPNEFFAFSSDISSLATLRCVKPYLAVSSSKIASYLSIKDCEAPYSPSTHFTEIRSILPGQLVSFSAQKLSSKMYVRYRTDLYQNLKSPQDYGAVFLDLFKKSVLRATSNKNNIGLQLSGGLDSSSVSSITRLLRPDSPLNTFYTDTGTDLANEAHFAEDVAKNIGASHHIVRPDYERLDSVIQCTQIYGQPIFASTGPSLMMSLFEQVSELGCDAMLTGHDGDSVVGQGSRYIADLFRKGDWLLLREELEHVAQQDKFSALYGVDWYDYSIEKKRKLIFNLYFERELTQNVRDFSLKNSFQTLRAGYSDFDIMPSTFFRNGFKKVWQKLATRKNSYPLEILADDLPPTQNRVEGESYVDTGDSDGNNINSLFYNDLCYNQNIRVNEEQYSIGKHFDISVEHPFFDPKLYEFCQSTPAHILFDHGRGRGPLRTAMKDILIEKVRNRTSKGIYNDYARNEALRLYVQAGDFLTGQSPVWTYVSREKFGRAITILKQDNHSINSHGLMIFFVYRTIFLAIWLDQNP